MVVGRFGLHYGAAAMRFIFLAIFYVEAPVQILQLAAKRILGLSTDINQEQQNKTKEGMLA